MFFIYGGQAEFEQWAQDQLVVNPCMMPGDAVVFRAHGKTYATEAYEREYEIVADVPNFLLQEAGEILVDLGWGLDARMECRTTFQVIEREKPEDYHCRENIKYRGGKLSYNALTDKPFYTEFDPESGEEIVHPMDVKFLPWEMTANKSWFINEPEDPRHIEGRPCYVEWQIEHMEPFTGLEFVEAGTNTNGETVYKATGTQDGFVLDENLTYVMCWPDEWVACNVYSMPDGKVFIGDPGIVEGIYESGFAGGSGEPCCIVADNTGNYEIYTCGDIHPTELELQTEREIVYPLEEKFMPESVAGVVLRSSTGSGRRFKLTVDDDGNITATEV